MISFSKRLGKVVLTVLSMTLYAHTLSAEALSTQECQEISSCTFAEGYSKFLTELQAMKKRPLRQASKTLKKSCRFVQQKNFQLEVDDLVGFNEILQKCKKYQRTFTRAKKKNTWGRIKKKLSSLISYMQELSSSECDTAQELYCSSNEKSAVLDSFARQLPVGQGPDGEPGGSAGGCGLTIFMCDPLCQIIESPAEESFCTAASRAGVCFADSGQCSGPWSSGTGGNNGGGANGGNGGNGGVVQDDGAGIDDIGNIDEAILACNQDMTCLCNLYASYPDAFPGATLLNSSTKISTLVIESEFISIDWKYNCPAS